MTRDKKKWVSPVTLGKCNDMKLKDALPLVTRLMVRMEEGYNPHGEKKSALVPATETLSSLWKARKLTLQRQFLFRGAA